VDGNIPYSSMSLDKSTAQEEEIKDNWAGAEQAILFVSK